ncbi:hypothetical protein [Edaphobacter sp. HDX4]|uniref:hypothetical protein n=1 Tax=Edaphobacter sp. HDX4 TaxID=2794064 RepID=UPI002FE606D8
MKKRSGALWAVLIVVLAVIVFVYRDRIHFDWANFWEQLRYISAGHAIAGIALIYATYWLRAFRWSVLVQPTKEVKATALIGPQFIGFTAVALFGRLATLRGRT